MKSQTALFELPSSINSQKRRRATCEWIEVRCLISGAREQHNQIFLLPVSGSLCFEARFCLHYHCARRPEQERKWSEPLTGKKIYLNMLLLCTRDLMSDRGQTIGRWDAFALKNWVLLTLLSELWWRGAFGRCQSRWSSITPFELHSLHWHFKVDEWENMSQSYSTRKLALNSC